MRNTLRDALAPVLIGASLAGALCACGPTHSSHITPVASAQAKSDAKALSRCLPQSALGQVELIKSLGSKSGRVALEAKCGVPPAKRQATEAEILNAAEHGHLTSPGGRQTFIEVTLPQIIERNQG